MNGEHDGSDGEGCFATHARGIVLAWLALIALMLASLGSAYLKLGLGNTVVGLAIAAVKSLIVLVVFMRISAASSMVRVVIVAALATLTLLVSLSSVDYMTRPGEPAIYQPPRQVPALNGAEPSSP